MISIYALINPLDGKVFYVGASESPKERFVNHCGELYGTYKCNTIRDILNSNKKPELLILKEGLKIKDVSFFEDLYIKEYNLTQAKSTYSNSYKHRKDTDGSNYTATPVRLGELLEPLKAEAKRLNRSLSWLIISILKQHPCIQEYLKNKAS